VSQVGRFAGRVVMVTGAGRGLCRAICLAVGREGASVVPTSRTLESATSVAREIQEAGGSAVPYALDVTSPEHVASVVQTILADRGRVDVLVNNAGILGPIEWTADFPVGAWDEIFATNVRGAFLTCRAVLPSMVARGKGKIVNVGAGVLDRVDLGVAAYSASTAALIVFTRMLAAEYRDSGVIAHVIDPGGLDTGMTAEIIEAEDARPKVGASQFVEPDRRLRRPEDIMPMVLFALSDESNMMTGQFFRVSSRGNPLYLSL
jgi:NAD(P)-dependent dehydrogenase (short-subunit alcohol dehydrogenase family)